MGILPGIERRGETHERFDGAGACAQAEPGIAGQWDLFSRLQTFSHDIEVAAGAFACQLLKPRLVGPPYVGRLLSTSSNTLQSIETFCRVP